MSDTSIGRVRGIVYRPDGKLLLCKIKGNDYWCLPGGGLDHGEDIISCLSREMIEETGIKPDVGELLYIYQYKQNNLYQEPEFFFLINNYEDYKNIDLSGTTHGHTELADIKFIDLLTFDEKILPEFITETAKVQGLGTKVVIDD